MSGFLTSNSWQMRLARAILFTSTCYPIKHECYTHFAEEETEE